MKKCCENCYYNSGYKCMYCKRNKYIVDNWMKK